MQIVEYDPKYKSEFVRLNTEWLEKLYYIESYDQYAMDHVEELIEKGSMVYFAVENEKVLATCMIEPLGDDVWGSLQAGGGWSIYGNWSRFCGAESLHGLRDCSRRKKAVPDYNFRAETSYSSLQKIRIC